MIVRVDNKVHLVPLGEIPGTVQNHIRSRLTFPNPAFLEADKRGFWTGDIEQEIKGYLVEGDTLVIPRGFTRQLVGILQRAEVQYRIEDRRRVLSEEDFTFKGDLHDFQVEAVEAMEKRDFGTLADRGVEAALLTGDLGNGERARVVEALSAGAVKVLVATGQLIGEGFDCRELSTLFLATPIKFNGRLLQYLGRVLRPAPGKIRLRCTTTWTPWAYWKMRPKPGRGSQV